MRFLVICCLLVLGVNLVSVEGKSVAKSPVERSICLIPVECFIDPCMFSSCDGICASDCYCNAICR